MKRAFLHKNVKLIRIFVSNLFDCVQLRSPYLWTALPPTGARPPAAKPIRGILSPPRAQTVYDVIS